MFEHIFKPKRVDKNKSNVFYVRGFQHAGTNWVSNLLNLNKKELLKKALDKKNNRSDTIPYFLGSDVFYMCSRGDPYLCVIHEAVAAKLPLVIFDKATIFEKNILKHFGAIVDYGDVKQVVNALNDIILYNKKSYFYKQEKDWYNFLDNNLYCESLFKL